MNDADGIARLQAIIGGMAERIAGQSELLSRTAEGRAVALLAKLMALAVAIGDGPTRPLVFDEASARLVRPRAVTPEKLWYSVTRGEWMLECVNVDGASRDFAVADMEDIR